MHCSLRLCGQTKPIRGATGADITENTLRKTMKDLGLKQEIRDLSYVEKRLVMVISLTRQLANAQGDLARTIEYNGGFTWKQVLKNFVNASKSGVKVAIAIIRKWVMNTFANRGNLLCKYI